MTPLLDQVDQKRSTENEKNCENKRSWENPCVDHVFRLQETFLLVKRRWQDSNLHALLIRSQVDAPLSNIGLVVEPGHAPVLQRCDLYSGIRPRPVPAEGFEPTLYPV